MVVAVVKMVVETVVIVISGSRYSSSTGGGSTSSGGGSNNDNSGSNSHCNNDSKSCNRHCASSNLQRSSAQQFSLLSVIYTPKDTKESPAGYVSQSASRKQMTYSKEVIGNDFQTRDKS